MPQKPLSDEEIETFIHDRLRASVPLKAETPFGEEILRIVVSCDIAALLRLEKLRSGDAVLFSVKEMLAKIKDRNET